MRRIEHMFFDLDRTLWDFETNSKTVLEMLYRDYGLSRYFEAFPLFYQKYQAVNDEMWQQYYKKQLTKDDVRLLRFYNTIGVEQKMCEEISLNYVELSALQTGVFPQTHEVLEALKSKGYKLHIITNGFREVQHNKLINSNLGTYFDTVTTSEDAKCHKPDIRAYFYALKEAETIAAKSAMIGDDLDTDIKGAKNVGMKSIYFNPKRHAVAHEADKEIFDLPSLLKIF